MSLNEQTGYLNIDNAHLRVEGNIVAENIELGNIQIGPTYGLSSVTDVGNTTSQTVQFTNAATGLVTTGNVTVGKELTVTGNVTMSEELIVTGNVVMTGTGALTLPSGTTAQQPTGVEGMVRFNTTTNRMEFYSGTEWRSLGGVSASGGTVTTTGGYRIHTFTSDGTFTPNVNGTVEYLLVGGGGGGGVSGGSGGSGGGGAGGVLHGSFMVVGGTAYDVDVGLGGFGVSNTAAHTQGGKGQNSSVFGLIAYGGGGGTGGGGTSSQTNSNGGSGSGQGTTSSVLNPEGPGIGTVGSRPQGTNGGYASTTGNSAGGGGGGAGTAGGDGSDTLGGLGGDGIEWPPGSNDYYAGGGAGSTTNGTTISQGGNGGGGNTFADGTDGTGGGGGGGHNNTTDSGAGGSGIVIIRYLL